MSALKMKGVSLITILLGMLVAGLETRMCSVSLETVQLVHACPLNKHDWDERESVLRCSEKKQNCSSPFKFKYHCVRDSYGKLIEVCAPLTILKGNICPEFNHGGERIQEDYTSTGICKSCPFSYSSNEIFYYPECLETLHGTNATLNSNIQSSYDASTTLNSIINAEDEGANMSSVIAACVVSICILVFIVVLVLKKCKWNNAPKKHVPNCTENNATTMLGTGEDIQLRTNHQEEDNDNEHVVIKLEEDYKKRNEQLKEGKKAVTLPDVFYKWNFAD